MSPFDHVLFERPFKKNILSLADDKSLDESFTIPTATNVDGNSIYSATARKIFFCFIFLS